MASINLTCGALVLRLVGIVIVVNNPEVAAITDRYKRRLLYCSALADYYPQKLPKGHEVLRYYSHVHGNVYQCNSCGKIVKKAAGNGN